MRKLCSQKDGGIVLEASLLLPFLLAFLVALLLLLQVCMVELALRSAVSEAVKTLATQLYPLKLLVSETEHLPAEQKVAEIRSRVQQARADAVKGEELPGGYEAYISDELLQLLQLRSMANGELAAALTPFVYAYCDKQTIAPAEFQVVDVTLPSLANDSQTYVMIEAQVTWQLRVPFFSRTMVIRKRALERGWTGV